MINLTVSFISEKKTENLKEIIRIILTIVVLAWVGWIIAGLFGWQETIIEIGKLLLIGIGIVITIVISYRIYRYKEEDKKLREMEAEKRAFEEKQREKGLVKFVDRFGNELWGTPTEVERWKKADDIARTRESKEYGVIEAIKQFKPIRKLKDEYVYKMVLCSWLQNRFPNIDVEKQKGSSRPDIIIDNIGIEIKGPTNRTDQLDSIVGKLLRYPQHFEKIIVVLFDVTINESYYNEWLKGLKMKFPEVEVIRKD